MKNLPYPLRDSIESASYTTSASHCPEFPASASDFDRDQKIVFSVLSPRTEDSHYEEPRHSCPAEAA